MRIVVSVGDGIGNLVETLPAVKAVMRKHPDSKLVMVDTAPNNFAFTEHLFKNHPCVESVRKGAYLGTADLIYNLPYANPVKLEAVIDGSQPIPEITRRYEYSEIGLNIMVVMGKGFNPDDSLYNVSEFLPVHKMEIPVYDVVAHNGRSIHNPAIWDVKLVHNFHHIVEYLTNKGLKVAVVGSKGEYPGVGADETGRPIQESIELIRHCGFYVGNDTGTYHIAAALRKPGVVMFTATSPVKNYDPKFHSTIKIIRMDLPCSPCQVKGNGFWMRGCDSGQKCRSLLSYDILKEIYSKIKEIEKCRT